MENIQHRKELSLIAEDYYFSKLTIGEIAKKYNLSRYLITKYLDEATASGLVTIKIYSPITRNFELELKFKKQFPKQNIYIVKNSNHFLTNGENVIQFAAEQAQIMIADSKIVGLTWGNTINQVIHQLGGSIKNDLTFTQFLGENIKYGSSNGSMKVIENSAEKFGAHYIPMIAPLYILNDQVRNHLKHEPSLKEAFDFASKMDLIITEVGTLDSLNSISFWKENRERIFPGVDFDQVAGLIYGRPYDINGQLLNPDENKVFGVDLQTILKTPRRLGIISGKFKSQATLGLLNSQLVTDVIMDEAVANRIINK
ncbi:sugar-binding transcriptional regulator [Lentilactobacillus laojiaonis]|uniref:sugar-binding transcriptional regulator n=1 Tax=Lentilactobacillus laojiaonis TaxID=2883998 RepID=UPI001D0A6241|nr:sugar-binding domain-containing protein [Lentilactobacillus laojiaonis]UDM32078.1 sugar-binding transcriptional regulator [Lentilactobacillus laojiaonis]